MRDENENNYFTLTIAIEIIKISKFHGDVSYVEAEAMEWGMQVAREARVKAIIVESDS